MRAQLSFALLMAALLLTPAPSAATPITFSAAGAGAADILGTVNSFRTALGTLNANVAGSFGSGRREINWDGVPDGFSAPNAFPANFFNSNSPRGVTFSTPGTGFQVSATAASGTPIEFGNIDPNYTALFATFSAQRLFTPIGSTITDVNFFVPGSSTPAFTNGFGAVFTDVDVAGASTLEFFDVNNLSLGSFGVPAATGDGTLSFLGVQFTEGSIVSRVRITSGNQILAAGNTSGDVTALDDFIYGEPTVPEPASLSLVALGGGLLWRRLSRRGQH